MSSDSAELTPDSSQTLAQYIEQGLHTHMFHNIDSLGITFSVGGVDYPLTVNGV